MPTLPSNPHSVGDSGHVNDHNTIVTALANAIYSSPSADQTITAGSATVTPLIVKGASGQTDKLLEAQNSASTVVSSIANDGQIYAGGGAYPLPFRIAAGAQYGGAVSTTVTYPAGRFSVAPIVLIINDGNVGRTLTANTTASFTYINAGGGNSTIFYIAIQMTSGSAAG